MPNPPKNLQPTTVVGADSIHIVPGDYVVACTDQGDLRWGRYIGASHDVQKYQIKYRLRIEETSSSGSITYSYINCASQYGGPTPAEPRSWRMIRR